MLGIEFVKVKTTLYDNKNDKKLLKTPLNVKDFEEKKKITDRSKEIVEFDPKKHNPVFYGYGYLFSMLDDEKLLVKMNTSLFS